MPKVVIRTLLVLGAVICAVLPGAWAGVRVSSGIEGQSLIGPTCPAARAGFPACNDRPYRVMVSVTTSGGVEVARFVTDAGGKFRVPLEPGWYSIRAVTARRMTVVPEPVNDRIAVVAGQFTVLKLVFDSGRR